MRLRRDWRTLTDLANHRQAIAAVVLDTLIAKIPPGAPAGAEVLVGFGLDELTQALQANLSMAGRLPDPLAAADRGLLYLHDHRVIVLQGGVGVFRQAMTIRVLPEAKGRGYTKGHYAPLAVGDDDQNIYAFRGASVDFIRRFREDYGATVHYLVENYRSTGHIIAAANALICARPPVSRSPGAATCRPCTGCGRSPPS